MNKIRWVVGTAVAVALIMALGACASVPKLTGSEKIALVNFTIEKSIVKDGDSADPGPGILNDRTAYYKYHNEALAKAWEVFKPSASSIFGASRLVDISTVEGNADIMALTAPPPPKVVMGKDTTVAAAYLYPEGLNYMNIYDAKLDAKIAAIAKADILVSIDNRATYAMSAGLAIGGIGGGKAKMILYSTLIATTAQGKVLRQVQLKGVSKEDATFLGTGIDPKEYPRLIASAQEDLNAKLAKEIAAW